MKIKYQRQTLKLNTIYGITELGNEASHKALLKIGLDYLEDFNHGDEQLKLRWYSINNK